MSHYHQLDLKTVSDLEKYCVERIDVGRWVIKNTTKMWKKAEARGLSEREFLACIGGQLSAYKDMLHAVKKIKVYEVHSIRTTVDDCVSDN
jgi:hypothetical protein